MKYIKLAAIALCLNSSIATISDVDKSDLSTLKDNIAKRNDKRAAAKTKAEEKAAKAQALIEAKKAEKSEKLNLVNSNYDKVKQECLDYIKSKSFKEKQGFESKFKYNLKKHTLIYFATNPNSQEETIKTFSCKTGMAIGKEKVTKKTMDVPYTGIKVEKTSKLTKKERKSLKENETFKKPVQVKSDRLSSYAIKCMKAYSDKYKEDPTYSSLKNGVLYLREGYGYKVEKFTCPK